MTLPLKPLSATSGNSDPRRAVADGPGGGAGDATNALRSQAPIAAAGEAAMAVDPPAENLHRDLIGAPRRQEQLSPLCRVRSVSDGVVTRVEAYAIQISPDAFVPYDGRFA